MASLASSTTIGETDNILDEVFPEIFLLIINLLDGMSYYMLASTCKRFHQRLSCQWLRHVDYLRTAGNYNCGDGLRYSSVYGDLPDRCLSIQHRYACAIANGHLDMIPDDIRDKLPLELLSSHQRYDEIYQRLQKNPEAVEFDHIFELAHVSVDAVRWLMEECHLKDNGVIKLMVNGFEEAERHHDVIVYSVRATIARILGNRHMGNLLIYMKQAYPGLIYKWIEDRALDYKIAFRHAFKGSREDTIRFLIENRHLGIPFDEIETVPWGHQTDQLVISTNLISGWINCRGNTYLILVQLEYSRHRFTILDIYDELLASKVPRSVQQVFLNNPSSYHHTTTNHDRVYRGAFNTADRIPSIEALYAFVAVCNGLMIGENAGDAKKHIARFIYAFINGIIYCGHAQHLSLLKEAISLFEYDSGDFIEPCSLPLEGKYELDERTDVFTSNHFNVFENWPYIFFEGRRSLHRCDLPIFDYMLRNYPKPWQRFTTAKVNQWPFATLRWPKKFEVFETPWTVLDMVRKGYEWNPLVSRLLPRTKVICEPRSFDEADVDIGRTELELFSIQCDHLLHCIERLHWFLAEAGTSHPYVDSLMKK